MWKGSILVIGWQLKCRTHWKTTLRSAPVLGYVLLGQWHEEVRIFRWKWQAKAAAVLHKLTAARDVLTAVSIEPYLPGANILHLRSHVPRR